MTEFLLKEFCLFRCFVNYYYISVDVWKVSLQKTTLCRVYFRSFCIILPNALLSIQITLWFFLLMYWHSELSWQISWIKLLLHYSTYPYLFILHFILFWWILFDHLHRGFFLLYSEVKSACRVFVVFTSFSNKSSQFVKWIWGVSDLVNIRSI